jgi:uncharacterized protein
MKNKNIQYKNFEVVDLKFDEETGVFEGYGSTFGNKDRGNDVVVNGAFSKCLSTKKLEEIDLLYSHDVKEIIGEFLEMREDGKGLWFKGRLWVNNIKRAAEVHFLMLKKKLKAMSIGFITIEREFKGRVRYLKELDLLEISVVRRPMNTRATITGVKSMTVDEVNEEIKSLADVEELFKELGLSDKASNAVIAKIAEFKKISAEPEKKKEGTDENKGDQGDLGDKPKGDQGELDEKKKEELKAQMKAEAKAEMEVQTSLRDSIANLKSITTVEDE